MSASEWIDQVDALCVTLTDGCTPEAAARTLGLADLTEFADVGAALAWTQAGDYDRSWFATGRVGALTFVWEDNGWQGVSAVVAVPLAGTGRLVSLFWNVESVMQFLVVEDGRVVRDFDPLFRDGDPGDGEPLPGEGDLDWEGAPRAAGVILLTSTTGVERVTPEWLELPGVRFWGHRF